MEGLADSGAQERIANEHVQDDIREGVHQEWCDPNQDAFASANDGIDYVREVCKGGTRNGLQTVSKDIRASNCNLRRTRQAHC